MPILRSIALLLALCLAPPRAGDWTLVEIGGQWGLRVSGRQILTLDGRQIRSGAKPTDSLELRLCSDSMEIVPESPDTAYPQSQEWKVLRGPFRFGSWLQSTYPISVDDLRAGTGIEPPWRMVHGKNGSGFVNPGWITFCAMPNLLGRIKKPTLVRHPFMGLVSDLLSSPPSTPRWRGVATEAERVVAWPGDTSTGWGARVLDTSAEDDFRQARWLVSWPGAGGVRWVAGKENLVQVREAGKPTRFIHFQDPYSRIAQRVESLGANELVMEWTAIYGDGNWDEIARIGPDRFRFTVNGGMSGGEGNDISPEEEKLAASGTWRIDPKSGKILLKKWRQKEKAILDR
jgi:hypothetical protein